MCTINENHMMYASLLGHRVQQTEFLVMFDHFLPFYPTKNPKFQNFEKMKKTLDTCVPQITII